MECMRGVGVVLTCSHGWQGYDPRSLEEMIFPLFPFQFHKIHKLKMSFEDIHRVDSVRRVGRGKGNGMKAAVATRSQTLLAPLQSPTGESDNESERGSPTGMNSLSASTSTSISSPVQSRCMSFLPLSSVILSLLFFIISLCSIVTESCSYLNIQIMDVPIFQLDVQNS